MKKILYLAILIIAAINSNASANSLVPTDTEPIDFTRDKPIYSPNDPRKPRLQTQASYSTIVEGNLVDLSYINLSIQNFTGNVTVEVVGENGFTTSFYCEGSVQEIIPIDELPEGSYTLNITLQNKGTYVGYFDL